MEPGAGWSSERCGIAGRESKRVSLRTRGFRVVDAACEAAVVPEGALIS